MYGKKECKITYEQGKLAIYTPYSSYFVTEIKKIDGAKWNGSCWMVNKEYLKQVQEILESIYDDVDVDVVRTLEIDFLQDVTDFSIVYYEPPYDRYSLTGRIPFFDCKNKKFFDNIDFVGEISFHCQFNSQEYDILEDTYLTIKEDSIVRLQLGQEKADKLTETLSKHKEIRVIAIDDESEE